MTRRKLRSPNPRLLQAAQRSSQEIFCLDNAFRPYRMVQIPQAGSCPCRTFFSCTEPSDTA